MSLSWRAIYMSSLLPPGRHSLHQPTHPLPHHLNTSQQTHHSQQPQQTINMQFFAVLASSVLVLSSGAQAWTQDGNGVWVANNNWWTIRNTRVHEACTRMNSDKTILVNVPCAYWTDGAGGQFHGTCRSSGGTVSCS